MTYGLAYKNGVGQCSVFEGQAYESTCIANAPNSNFEEDLSNEALLEGLESVTELMRGAAILGLGATALVACVLSVVCAGLLAATTPEGAAFTPWVYAAMLARGLGLIGAGAGSGSLGVDLANAAKNAPKRHPGPGTPRVDDTPNPAEIPDLASVSRVKDGKLKEYVGDIHGFKESIIERGAQVSRYDVFIDNDSGYYSCAPRTAAISFQPVITKT